MQKNVRSQRRAKFLAQPEGIEILSVLPDVLKPGLKIVFCGMAAGQESAARGRIMPDRGTASGKRCTKLAFALLWDIDTINLDIAISFVDHFFSVCYLVPGQWILTKK